MTDPALEAAQLACGLQHRHSPVCAEFSNPVAAVREALLPLRRIIESARDWNPYDTRDIGDAYLADTVHELLDELSRLIYPNSEIP
ncbi:hypothetical protein [Mycolicibacterium sp.]|uniref:hypothetical protein n=1 Tax=Mycolicibacterium sp. TaxID=2320850 RepID=UPI0035611A3B